LTPENPLAICSAKGCRQPAAFVLQWRNPRLHTADRRKTWVACGEHREHLATFLDVRGFLLAVEPLAPTSEPPVPEH
jgi:hypothetical protein